MTIFNEIATRYNAEAWITSYDYLPDPDPILRKLGKDITICKELLSDSHVESCVTSRKAGVKSKEWGIDRCKAPSRHTKFIQDILTKELDTYSIISDILNASLYGYQPIEIVWQPVNNLILPAKVEAKPAQWFNFDSDNNLRFKKSGFSNGVIVPERKFLLPRRNPSYENPYGEKVLSKCFWPATFKKGGMKFWATFIEKYGMAKAVGKLPNNQINTDVGRDFIKQLHNMVQDAVAVIPDNGSIELLEASGKSASSDVYKTFATFYNQEISKAIIGQTLTTEITGNQGSYAASQTHQQVREDIILEDSNLVESTMNQLVRWIIELNFSSFDELPKFKLYEEENINKDKAERDKILVDTGIKFTKDYYKRSYNLEEKDFEVAEPVKENQPTPEGDASSFAEKDENPNDVVKLFENLYSDKELQEQSAEMLAPVLKIINESNDYNEALEKLNEIFPKMSSDKLIDKLSQLMFLANLQGMKDIGKE